MQKQAEFADAYQPCVGQPEVDRHCTCPSQTCPVHKVCCACVAWHRDHALRPLPHCLRGLEEVTWRMRSERK